VNAERGGEPPLQTLELAPGAPEAAPESRAGAYRRLTGRGPYD
jgi:hypothetical protein